MLEIKTTHPLSYRNNERGLHSFFLVCTVNKQSGSIHAVSLLYYIYKRKCKEDCSFFLCCTGVMRGHICSLIHVRLLQLVRPWSDHSTCTIQLGPIHICLVCVLVPWILKATCLNICNAVGVQLTWLSSTSGGPNMHGIWNWCDSFHNQISFDSVHIQVRLMVIQFIEK